MDDHPESQRGPSSLHNAKKMLQYHQLKTIFPLLNSLIVYVCIPGLNMGVLTIQCLACSYISLVTFLCAFEYQSSCSDAAHCLNSNVTISILYCALCRLSSAIPTTSL